MVRLLLATTAVAAILATGALAQDASSSFSMPMDSSMMSSASSPADNSGASSSMMEPSTMSSQMSTASSMESSMMDTASSMMSSAPADNATTTTTTTTTVTPRTTVQILSGYTRVDSDQLATKIIGKPVFDSKAKDANNLGNINDLVLNTSGDVAAVVLGVGGFLGIGEKQVAVDYSALQWVIADDNTERFVLQTTKDELTNAPDFVSVDDQPAASNAPADATASSSVAQ